MKLNKSQQDAVRHNTGPMLVLAGPGSGKTRVITERIKYLVDERGVSPGNILVVTFTKAAALEMRSRYHKSGSGSGVTFGTFHSIFFSILKRAYRYTAADVISEDERRKFISQMLRKSGSADESDSDSISDILGEISRVKSGQYNIEDYYPLSCPDELFKEIYAEYGRWLKKNRKIDFEDMIIYTYDLFYARKDILELYQKQYRYIMIDEFQDINYPQYRIIKMMAGPDNNLFVVGDDDQSIYRFRGANPEIMMMFEKDYPDADRVVLDINYRCSGNIADAASRLISHNKVRFLKKLTAYNADGESIEVKEFDNLQDENKYVVDMIKKHSQEGGKYSDIAVLYRTNIQPAELVGKFMEYNIPIRLKEGIPNIYEHWIARDIFAYIRLGMGYRDRETFVRIMNKPTRYISRAAIDDSVIDFDRLLALYDDKKWMCDRIEQMVTDIRSIYKMKPHRGLRYIDKVVGYGDYLEEYAAGHGIEPDNLREVYEQLYHDAAGYDNYEDWFAHIEQYGKWRKEGFLGNAGITERGAREASDGRDRTDDAVNLMTLHGAKGLEYDNVIIVDVNETIMPHKMSVKPEDMEEERRMFYVGMTRAKKRLYLLYSKHRYNQTLEPSRFLEEIGFSHLP